MRRFDLTLLATLTVVVLTLPTAAATIQELDLQFPYTSDDPAVHVAAGELTVKLVNLIPSEDYRWDWEIGVQEILPLPLPQDLKGTVNSAGSRTDSCPDLSNAVEDLRSVGTEAEVLDAIEIVEREILTCADPSAKGSARRVIDGTSAAKPFTIKRGEELRLRIVRYGANGKVAKTWRRVFRAPLGEWRSSYGFTFIPNEDERYFTRAVEGEEGMFEIVEKSDNQEFDFAPSIFYSWQPWASPAVTWGLTAGLGFDLERPVVFLGGIATIRENFSVVAGLVMHEQARLNGRYDLADPFVGEEFGEDQLVEHSYEPNWFVGVSFRFGSAPKSHKPADEKSGDGQGGGDGGNGNDSSDNDSNGGG